MSVAVAAVYAPSLDPITIASGPWSGVTGMDPGSALVASCATPPCDPNEVDRRAADAPAIPSAWDGDASR